MRDDMLDDVSGHISDEVTSSILNDTRASARRTAPVSPWADSQLLSALEKLPVPAYTCDTTGLITYFNQAAVRLWGREPRLLDPADRFCGSFKLFSSDGTPIRHDQCWMAMTLAAGREFIGGEILVERPDGVRRTALAYANPVRDDAGQMLGAVNVLIDITEHGTRDDGRPDTELGKDEFLAKLANELRVPLVPLRNAVSTLQSEGAPTAGSQEALRVMDRQLRMMSRLIDDLLDAARVATGSLRIDRVPADLSQAVALAVESTRPLIEDAKLRLELDMPSAPILLELDLARMTEVVANLLSNAAKYSRPGGRIRIAARREGEQAVLEVTDEGVGIAPLALSRVFERYIRIAKSVGVSHAGIGIGLPMAKRYVELHGGTISARSEGPGLGTEFIVRLPVPAAPPAGADASAGRHPAEKEPKQTLRVLVVDDDPDSTEMLASLLQLTGHTARVAHDGIEAIRAAEEFRPDVALLDLGLPEADGCEVARRIRGQHWGRDMVLVAISGWSDNADLARTRQAGFDRHLVKPVDPSALCRLLLVLTRQEHPAA